MHLRIKKAHWCSRDRTGATRNFCVSCIPMEFHENRPILSARPRINKDGNQGREITGRYIVHLDIANEVWRNVLHGFSRRADVSAYLDLSPTGVCSRRMADGAQWEHRSRYRSRNRRELLLTSELSLGSGGFEWKYKWRGDDKVLKLYMTLYVIPGSPVQGAAMHCHISRPNTNGTGFHTPLLS